MGVGREDRWGGGGYWGWIEIGGDGGGEGRQMGGGGDGGG